MLGAVALLSLSLLGTLVLMSAAMQNSAKFGALNSVLLLSNTAGLLAFVGLIGINVRRLASQLRRREPGLRTIFWPTWTPLNPPLTPMSVS